MQCIEMQVRIFEEKQINAHLLLEAIVIVIIVLLALVVEFISLRRMDSVSDDIHEDCILWRRNAKARPQQKLDSANGIDRGRVEKLLGQTCKRSYKRCFKRLDINKLMELLTNFWLLNRNQVNRLVQHSVFSDHNAWCSCLVLRVSYVALYTRRQGNFSMQFVVYRESM